MRQAHARLPRGEGQLVDSEAASVELHAVPPLDDYTDRQRRRSSFDYDSLDAQPAGRGRPRRPTGAAADYARGVSDGSRRTVRISGYGAQTALRPTPSELRGPRPDRVAAWGVGFAIFVGLLAALAGG
jgi:hypothetical protein